jgi:hypothetical protein
MLAALKQGTAQGFLVCRNRLVENPSRFFAKIGADS